MKHPQSTKNHEKPIIPSIETYLKEETNFNTHKGRKTKVSKQVFEAFCSYAFVKKNSDS
jgi:hypothetical protein